MATLKRDEFCSVNGGKREKGFSSKRRTFSELKADETTTTTTMHGKGEKGNQHK